MIRYLDVCSGYSAFTLASAGLGFECAGYSEIEPFPRAILEQRHHAVAVDWDHRHVAGSNFVPLFGDFTQIEAHHVGPVDLLAGGTPCQAFSVAGKRLGLDDPRGNLTLEFLALARRLRVRWLVWENVHGFLSHDGGGTMGTFLRILGECGYGYAWRVLDAQFIRVDGHEGAVPQRRKRVILVAHLGDATGPAAVLFERESLRGDPAPRRETGEGIARAVAPCTGKQGSGSGRAPDGRPAAKAYGGWLNCDEVDTAVAVTAHPGGRYDLDSETFIAEVSPTLSTRLKGGGGMGTDFDCDGGLVADVACTLPAGGNATGGARQPGMGAETAATMLIPVAHAFDARQQDCCQYGNLSPPLDTDGYTVGVAHPVAYSIMPQNSGKDFKAREVDVSQPLMAAGPVGGNQGGDYVASPVAFSLRGRDGEAQAEAAAEGLSPSLRTTGGGSSHAFVADRWSVRRFTPTECERLMGVPDGFTAITWRGKPAADGPRYKVLGNSQAANMMRWVARGLADVAAAQRAHVPDLDAAA